MNVFGTLTFFFRSQLWGSSEARLLGILFIYYATKFSVLGLCAVYECWNFNSGNYLFTTDTK